MFGGCESLGVSLFAETIGKLYLWAIAYLAIPKWDGCLDSN